MLLNTALVNIETIREPIALLTKKPIPPIIFVTAYLILRRENPQQTQDQVLNSLTQTVNRFSKNISNADDQKLREEAQCLVNSCNIDWFVSDVVESIRLVRLFYEIISQITLVKISLRGLISRHNYAPDIANQSAASLSQSIDNLRAACRTITNATDQFDVVSELFNCLTDIELDDVSAFSFNYSNSLNRS